MGAHLIQMGVFLANIEILEAKSLLNQTMYNVGFGGI